MFGNGINLASVRNFWLEAMASDETLWLEELLGFRLDDGKPCREVAENSYDSPSFAAIGCVFSSEQKT